MSTDENSKKKNKKSPEHSDRHTRSQVEALTKKSLQEIKDNVLQHFHRPTTSELGAEARTHDIIADPNLTVMQDMMQKFSDDLYKKIGDKVTEEVDNLKKHFDTTIEKKFKEVMDYVDKEISVVSRRVTELEGKMEDVQEIQEKEAEFNPDTTIVAINVPHEEDENLIEKVTRMIRRDLSINAPIVRVARLKEGPPRNTRRGVIKSPGLVKIQMTCLQDKIRVLREKRNLQNSPDFSNVFLRSSKPHAERIMEQNMKTLIDLIPAAKDYTISGNGKLVKKTNPGMQQGQNMP